MGLAHHEGSEPLSISKFFVTILAAHHLLNGTFETYDDAERVVIVMPTPR